MSSSCLYIKKTNFTEFDLYGVFSKFGNIKSIQIIKNNPSVQNGTYIDFDTVQECNKAYTKCNNMILKNECIGTLTKLTNLRNFRFWKNICSSYDVCVFNLYDKCKNAGYCPQHHISFEELGYVESLNIDVDLNIFCPKKNCTCMKEHNPNLIRNKWVYNIIMEELNKYFEFQIKKRRLNTFVSKMNLNENCFICEDNVANGIAMCSHKCCKKCWNKIMDTNNKCPMCRKKIEHIIYMDEL